VLSVLRPSFEVVKEGRILKKIKHLLPKYGHFLFGTKLVLCFGRKWGVFNRKNELEIFAQILHHFILRIKFLQMI